MRYVFIVRLGIAVLFAASGCTFLFADSSPPDAGTEGDASDLDASSDCTLTVVGDALGPLTEGDGADLSEFFIAAEHQSPPRLVSLTGCQTASAPRLRASGLEFGPIVIGQESWVAEVSVAIDATKKAPEQVAITLEGDDGPIVEFTTTVHFLPELFEGPVTDSLHSLVILDDGLDAPRGGNPLVIRSRSAIRLTGDFDVSAQGRVAGPGGGVGGFDNGADGRGGDPGGGGASLGGTCVGAGGGNGSAGADGSGTLINGIGGPVVGDASLLADEQPAGGGGGGACLQSGGANGGGGGGYLELSARGGIVATGSINARGGAGVVFGSEFGGRGAGGTVFLRARSFAGNLIVDVSSGGLAASGQGRFRADIANVAIAEISGQGACPQPGPDICAIESAAVFRGERLGAMPGPISADPIEIEVLETGVLHRVTIDGLPAGDTLLAPGAHEVCVINLRENGDSEEQMEGWLERAQTCETFAYLPLGG